MAMKFHGEPLKSDWAHESSQPKIGLSRPPFGCVGLSDLDPFKNNGGYALLQPTTKTNKQYPGRILKKNTPSKKQAYIESLKELYSSMHSSLSIASGDTHTHIYKSQEDATVLGWFE